MARKTSAKKAPALTPQVGGPTSCAKTRRFRRCVVRVVCVCGKCGLLLFLITLIWVGALRFINPPITGLMILRHFGEGQPIEKAWISYEDVSPHLLLAVLAAEDQRFYDHHGFDLKEIGKAIQERKDGGPRRGASTLSQQTAKNVFLWPTQSWWRKAAEVYFTVLIEALWPKRRILEVYANVAEMGPGVYGVESAARKYFNTSASRLTPQEAASLTSILPSPLTRDPRAPTAEMKERQAWTLMQMDRLGGVRFLK